MRRALVLLPLTALLVLGACGAPPTATVGGAPAPGAPAPGAPAWVQEMLSSINARRADAGVAPVQLCGSLMRAAQAHSEDQAVRATMSHTGSDGSSMVQRAERAGYRGWNNLAENVAAGQPDVGSVMGAWMNSSGHRANILGAAYQHVGLGTANAANGTPYWTQDFGKNGSC